MAMKTAVESNLFASSENEYHGNHIDRNQTAMIEQRTAGLFTGFGARMKFLPAFLLIATFSLHAGDCQPGTSGPCDIQLEGVLPSGKSFTLEINEASPPENPANNGRSGYWGANGNYPDSYLSKLFLAVNDSAFSIPRKVYSDLGNLYFAEVKENEHAIVLLLKGGEAAAAYYATFVFVDGKIRKRTVRSQENPDQVWEKSSFYGRM